MGDIDITYHIHQLEAAGFREEFLDKAVALGGASRLIYEALYQTVREGLSPEEAIRIVEQNSR